MSTLTVAQFRTDFPEFADKSIYSDASVTTWLNVALALLKNTDRWGALLTTGQELATAHYLVLAAPTSAPRPPAFRQATRKGSKPRTPWAR